MILGKAIGYLRAWWHRLRGKRTQRDIEERVVHALIRLRWKEPPWKDKVVLVACSCGRWFWRKNPPVLDAHLQGDWAKPFRLMLGVPTRAPSDQDLRRSKRWRDRP